MELEPKANTKTKVRIRELTGALYTRRANYYVNVGWRSIERTFESWNEGNPVDLDPDFQRAHVWTRKQQVAFVEYALRDGASGRDIYFNCADNEGTIWGHNAPVVLVDGKQRLEAVRQFLREEFPVFTAISGGRGYFASEIAEIDRTVVLNFIFHVNNLPTRAEVLKWYLEMNAGGTPHSPDEIARVMALYDAELVRMTVI